MALYSTATLPPIRTTFAQTVDKATLLSYVQDAPFMISLSEVATLQGPTQQPPVWLMSEIDGIYANTPDGSPPKVYTIKDDLGRFMPSLTYHAAFVHCPGGSRVVVEAMGTRMWTTYSIEESEEGVVTLVESSTVRAIKPTMSYVRSTYMSAHLRSSEKMKESIEGAR